MLATYRALASFAQGAFADIVVDTALVGGTDASPNKLRLYFIDQSYLDIWLSRDGDYAMHWERRRQTGQIFRWDNAPHHPQIRTSPHHFHDGLEDNVVANDLPIEVESKLSEILLFVSGKLSGL